MSACVPSRSRVKTALRTYPRIFHAVRWFVRAVKPFGIPNLPAIAVGYLRFLRDFRDYRRLPGGEGTTWRDLWPALGDRTSNTPVDLNYFYQDTWAAGKILAARPTLHVDLGSTALLVGILAMVTRVISVDVRPLSVSVDGLTACAGTGVALPFRSRSVRSLSSLCVIEHIGLGRYGDALDPLGATRAAQELQRVLSPGGDLYVSVPIELDDRTCFNGYRAFSVAGVMKLFGELEPEEVILVQGRRRFSADRVSEVDFDDFVVVGLFHFRRASH